ncbi:hypothetical protein KIN20_015362 [Parelaphostrongylus tenuis]|uniref:Uncharacterized protein n=1 Tax=Parelaphostrongylus tenuis TaxID=148309 RepID=A0AAD5N087_PARTN|nr:hypothetical protein KIN20_015362 [Parelaphostrongylus tenuis]
MDAARTVTRIGPYSNKIRINQFPEEHYHQKKDFSLYKVFFYEASITVERHLVSMEIDGLWGISYTTGSD